MERVLTRSWLVCIAPWSWQLSTNLLLAGLLCFALTGCGSKVETEKPAPATASQPTPAQEETTAPEPAAGAAAITSAQFIEAARTSLKAGNVDEAAARLAQLQLQGTRFNAQQAKDYRQALSEAYDRAIEGAQRGDPRAQAALQLLRAAGPR
ncbi:MAG: hypothetical protein FJ398_21980 [Verrucomicrobia bacterium]|nr:hypothetical protein [Verrucomicrobiota bacterium]